MELFHVGLDLCRKERLAMEAKSIVPIDFY